LRRKDSVSWPPEVGEVLRIGFLPPWLPVMAGMSKGLTSHGPSIMGMGTATMLLWSTQVPGGKQPAWPDTTPAIGSIK
jgi:hypothetical protein